MSVDSPHEILQANYLNFDAYTIAEHDFWQKNRILMLNMHFLFESPKVALNFSKNTWKSLSKGDWCSIKGANQARAMPDNKMPISPTWVGLVGYWWRWNRMTKHMWLTKPQNFECVLSNLLSRLICGSFGWGCVAKTHPKNVKVWLICKLVINS